MEDLFSMQEYESEHEKNIIDDFFETVKDNKSVDELEFYIFNMFIQLEEICSPYVKIKWENYLLNKYVSDS